MCSHAYALKNTVPIMIQKKDAGCSLKSTPVFFVGRPTRQEASSSTHQRGNFLTLIGRFEDNVLQLNTDNTLIATLNGEIKKFKEGDDPVTIKTDRNRYN